MFIFKLISFEIYYRDGKTPRSFDQSEADAYTRLAAGEVRNNVLPPISLFDLRDTIQVCKQLIGNEIYF